MNMAHKFLIPSSMLCLLAACGGSSVSNQERVVSLSNNADELFETFVEDQNVLPASALPTSDSADYSGAIFAIGGTGDFEDDTDEVLVVYIGELDLTVDFEDGTLTGSGHDFANVENIDDLGTDNDPIVGGTVDGTLVFAGEQSDSTGAVYELLASGDLSGPNGSFLSYHEVGGAADVYGTNADVLNVAGGATVTFDDQPGFVGFAGIASK